MEPSDPIEKLAKRLVDELNYRSGINIDFDEVTMASIYHEMGMTIAEEMPTIIADHFKKK